MNYSIKEVAKKLNITKHTLYYYEKADLLPNIKRDSQGNRIYDESDVAWIYLICCLRDINMPIQSIKEYVQLLKNQDSTMSERKGAILSFQKKVETDIQKHLMIQKLITKKLDFYNELEESLSTNEIESCYNYKEDWEHFKNILEETINE